MGTLLATWADMGDVVALLSGEAQQVVDSGRGADLRRQRIPLQAGAQHVQNGSQHLPVVTGRTPALGTRLMWWQQGLRPLPYVVTQLPWVGPCHRALLPGLCALSLPEYLTRPRFSNKDLA